MAEVYDFKFCDTLLKKKYAQVYFEGNQCDIVYIPVPMMLQWVKIILDLL